MAFFAKVVDGLVVNVVDADQTWADSQDDTYIETFLDGSERGCYAGIGYTYDDVADIFEAPVVEEE